MATITPVNVGVAANDDTGDPLRTAFQSINANEAALNAETTGNTAAIAGLGALASLNTAGTSQIDNGAVTLAKNADMATDSLLGRDTAGVGPPEVLTPAQVRTILNVAGALAALDTADTAQIDNEAITRPKLGARSIDAQTGTGKSIVAADQNGVVTMDNAAANTITINTNATTALNVGHQTDIIQLGAGVTTVDAAVGVTLNGVSGGAVALSGQFEPATILKVATDTWVIFGGIGTVA
jgi:hypothetical protein